MGESENLQRQRRTNARDVHPLRRRSLGSQERQGSLAVLSIAERHMEVHMGDQARRRPPDFFKPGYDASRLERDSRPVQHRIPGLRHLRSTSTGPTNGSSRPPSPTRPTSPTTTTRPAATGRTFNIPAGMERQGGLRPFRRGQIRLLRLGQRPLRRLQRRFQDAGRMGHHHLCPTRAEHDRPQSPALVGRILSRMPGLLPAERHRARRLSLPPRPRSASAISGPTPAWTRLTATERSPSPWTSTTQGLRSRRGRPRSR